MVRTLDAPEWLVHVCWYGALSVGGGVGCCLLGAVGTFTADCCRAPTVGRAVAVLPAPPGLSDRPVSEPTGAEGSGLIGWVYRLCYGGNASGEGR